VRNFKYKISEAILKSIQFSSLISENELTQSIFQEEFIEVLNYPIIPPKTRNFLKKVPEHITKIFFVPNNINLFIETLLPNMTIYIQSKLPQKAYLNPDIVQEVLSKFVIYMLDSTKEGIPRYKTYDPVNYPDQPYFKWFLMNLSFFIKGWDNKHHIEKITYNFSACVSPDQQDTEGYQSFVERYGGEVLETDTQIQSKIVVEKLVTSVKKLSERYQGSLCFEAHAHEFLLAKLQGTSNAEFAKQLSISPSAVSQWLTKLRALITDFFQEEAALSNS